MKEWSDHVEVLTTSSFDRYLMLSVHLIGPSDSRDPSIPSSSDVVQNASIGDVLPELAFMIERSANAPDPSAMNVRTLDWETSRFHFTVVEIASKPDDSQLQQAAHALESARELNFTAPKSLLDRGFRVEGRAAGFPNDVTDYTVSWTPSDLAGSSRSAAVAMPDTGPTMFINVGCRFYGQGQRDLPTDPASATITTDAGLLTLSFSSQGTVIKVQGRSVSEQQLRDLATSLHVLNRDEWRAQLGDRLLIDTSNQSG